MIGRHISVSALGSNLDLLRLTFRRDWIANALSELGKEMAIQIPIDRSLVIVIVLFTLGFLFKEFMAQDSRKVMGQVQQVSLQVIEAEKKKAAALLVELTKPRDQLGMEGETPTPGRWEGNLTAGPTLLTDRTSSDEAVGPQPKTDKPKIAVMTLINGLHGIYSWMWPMSYHSKAVYCKRMGYDLIVGGKNDIEPERSSHWAKLTMMLRWLPHYDYIMWMDADTVITRYNFAIDTLILPDIDLVMARDWNNINSGVFLMKNSSWCLQFIREVLAVPLSSLVIREWEEQSAMIYVLERKRKYFRRIYVPPQRMMNSYPGAMAHGNEAAGWQQGDFLAHTPGCHGMEQPCRQAFTDAYTSSARLWKIPPIPKTIPQVVYPKAVPRVAFSFRSPLPPPPPFAALPPNHGNHRPKPPPPPPPLKKDNLRITPSH
jgi:hypothetical protein